MKIKYILGLFYQKSVRIYLLIGLWVFFVWHKVLNQTFLGEGYYYFDKELYLFKGWVPPNFGDYDNFAKIFFQIVTPFFKDNLIYYLIAELTMVGLFFIIFYKIIEHIVEDRFIATTATIFLSTNYVALFEYLGAGNYQRFIQRFPNLIPLIIAFYFLWKFCNSKKIVHLIYSILLYALSLLMGHFSALMLPLFLIYPGIFLLSKGINYKSLVSALLVCTFYLFVTYMLTRYSFQKPNYTLIEFLKTEPNILWRILYQIPVITIPLDILKYASLKYFLTFCLSFYLYGAFIVSRRLPKLTAFYITCFLSMIAVMFTYLYTDPRLDVTKSFGEDRYYLLSSFFATILWAMILKAIYVNNQKKLLLLSTIILFLFVYTNILSIWKHIDSIQSQSEMNKRLNLFIKENQYKYSNGTIIVMPYYLSWPMPMVTRFANRKISTSLPFENWDKNLRPNREKVFVYDYLFPNNQSTNPRLDNGKIIDLTEKYRSGGKITFQK